MHRLTLPDTVPVFTDQVMVLACSMDFMEDGTAVVQARIAPVPIEQPRPRELPPGSHANNRKQIGRPRTIERQIEVALEAARKLPAEFTSKDVQQTAGFSHDQTWRALRKLRERGDIRLVGSRQSGSGKARVYSLTTT